MSLSVSGATQQEKKQASGSSVSFANAALLHTYTHTRLVVYIIQSSLTIRLREKPLRGVKLIWNSSPTVLQCSGLGHQRRATLIAGHFEIIVELDEYS